MEKSNPIEEAKRYLQNAKDLLKEKAIKENNDYKDAKYVRMAGDTAWKGCLIALEAVFEVKKTMPKNKRVSIDDYKDRIAKRDKKLLDNVMNAYNILHLFMGYDGIKSYPTCKDGIDRAEQIIKWCETKVKKAQ